MFNTASGLAPTRVTNSRMFQRETVIRRVLMNKFLTVAIATVFLAAYGFAQNATGTIDGSVLDASNSGVPDATVTVENQATNVKLTTRTNAEGRFYQRYLPPGTYNVTTEKGGFQKYVQ